MVASTTAKDLSWEEWTQDFTAQQSEYALPQVVSDENRLKKVQKLYVAYTLDTYSKTGAMKYTSARHVDRKTLPEDWSYYTANQSESDPIYTISDKAIFVAPISESTIANGLKLTGVKKIPDYTSSTTEE